MIRHKPPSPIPHSQTNSSDRLHSTRALAKVRLTPVRRAAEIGRVTTEIAAAAAQADIAHHVHDGAARVPVLGDAGGSGRVGQDRPGGLAVAVAGLAAGGHSVAVERLVLDLHGK